MDRDNKPHWFKDHEEDDMRNFGEIIKKLDSLNDKMEPVMQAYQTATTLGRWTKGLLAFVLICFGIWTGIKNIY